jgi:hypothetical protein
MWQAHNLKPWEFTALSNNRKSFLIASELIEHEKQKQPNKKGGK